MGSSMTDVIFPSFIDSIDMNINELYNKTKNVI